jgi:hypothetical protein
MIVAASRQSAALFSSSPFNAIVADVPARSSFRKRAAIIVRFSVQYDRSGVSAERRIIFPFSVQGIGADVPPT